MSDAPSPLPPDFPGFPDLAALKAAHARLLQQQHGNMPADDFLNGVEFFVIRAQATGQALGDEDDRTSAQNIIDYWVTVLLRGRRTPPETGLAEFGFHMHTPGASLREQPVDEYLTVQRTAIRRRLRLSAAAAQWHDAGRDSAMLWGGIQLEEASEYDDLSPLEHAFIEASRQQERIAARKRRIVRWAAWCAALVIVSLVIAFLYMRQRVAEQQRRVTQHQFATKLVERAAVLMRDGDVSGSLLWLSQALKEDIGAMNLSAQETHRVRLGAAIAQLPKLPQIFLEPDPAFLCSAAQLSDDGQFILTVASQRGGGAGVVRLWNATTGAELARFEEENAPINDAGFCADGRIFTASGAPGSGVGKVRLWKRDGQPSGELVHGGGAVLSAVASPGRDRVALLCEGWAGQPAFVEVIQFSDGVSHTGPLHWGGAIRAVSFSPDGNYVVACGSMELKEYKSARSVGQVQVWNAWTGAASTWGDLRHELPVNTAVFANDNVRLVTATGDLHGRIGTVELRNPFTGERYFAAEHAGPVVSASFSPDGRRVLSAGHDGTVRVSDARSGAILREFRHESSVYAAAFSPDGRYIVTGGRDHTARIWRMATGGLAVPPLYHGLTVARVAFSADCEQVVTTTSDGVRLWKLQTGEPVSPVLQLGDPIWKMTISADGRRVLAVSKSGLMGTWETETGKAKTGRLNALGSASAVFFSADASLALLSMKTTAEIWVLQGERPHKTVTFATGTAPTYAVFSPDGTRVLTATGSRGAHEGTARLWNATTGQPTSDPLPTRGVVTYSVFSEDGKYVLTASGTTRPAYGEARVWDAASGQPLTPSLFHNEEVTHASFDRSLTRVVTASVDDTGKIWTMDLKKRDAKEWRPLLEHTADLTHASFSPDGRLVVTASYDRTAVLWDAETGQRLRVLQHPGWINDAHFSDDSRLLVTACADQTARIWDTSTGDWVSLFRHDGEVTRSFFAGAEQNVVTLSAYGPAQALRDTQRSGLPAGTGTAEPIGDEARQRTLLKAQTWRLPAEKSPVEELYSFAALMRARAIVENLDFVRLDRDQFRSLYESLRTGFLARFNAAVFPVPPLYSVTECEAAGEWFAARWHLDRLRQGALDDVDLLVRRGDISANLREWEEAIRDYSKAVELRRDVTILSKLIRADLRLNRYAEALRLADEAIAMEPMEPSRELHMARAQAYAGLQRWQDAATDLLESIKLRPELPSSYQRLAVVRLRQGQIDEYRKLCREMIERFQDNDRLASTVAWACALSPESDVPPELIVQMAIRAITDQPGVFYLLNTLGASLYRAGRYEDAVRRLNESRLAYLRAASFAQTQSEGDTLLMPLQDGRPADWLFLAMAHARLGNTAEAQEWLRKAREAVTSGRVSDRRGIWQLLELQILLQETEKVVVAPRPP